MVAEQHTYNEPHIILQGRANAKQYSFYKALISSCLVYLRGGDFGLYATGNGNKGNFPYPL